ncbi:tetratricopeptide repeat protein [Chthoniobacter flavus]|uniref:tetratricopeptide repeat protein n=1 Tax=Chthoniobacter flavus TaxID=191863 RepID=UPI001404FEDD|nr:tetratricopeptide repeat protein [Chthoniobacter flavus]
MTFRPLNCATVMTGLALALGACGHVQLTHVPPGESLGVAMARKPDLVRLPAPPPGAVVQQASASNPNAGMREGDRISHVADAYSRGEFCMNAGKDDEAIAAFQEAVKIDPTFTDAWARLAALYEKKGDNKKAIDAFRRSKKVAKG